MLPISSSNEEQINQLKEKVQILKSALSNVICKLILNLDDYDGDDSDDNENVAFIKNILMLPDIDVNYKLIMSKKVEDDEDEDDDNQNIEELSLFNGEVEKIKIEYFEREYEASPLCCAVEKGNIELVKLLLAKPDIDINQKILMDSDIYVIESAELSPSALKMAESIVPSPETILNSEENLKKTYKYIGERKETNAFMLAIENKNEEIIKLLLSHPGLDINAKAIEKHQYIEAKFGTKKLYEQYKEYIEVSPLHTALDLEDNSEILDLLFKRPDLNINVKTVEISNFASYSFLAVGVFASIESDEPLLNSLLETKISLDMNAIELISKKEKNAIYYAIESNDFNVLNYLLSRDDLDINDKILEETDFKLHLSESELLVIQDIAPFIAEFINKLKEETKSMKKEETPLHLSVQKSKTDIIEALLKNKKIDIEATDSQGKKTIDLACNEEIKELLSNKK